MLSDSIEYKCQVKNKTKYFKLLWFYEECSESNEVKEGAEREKVEVESCKLQVES